MNRSELIHASTPESLVRHLSQEAPKFRRAEHDHGSGAGAMESVREDTYLGHHIVIRTTYHIEVDGVPIEGHMGVTNNGRVHYHAIPNLNFVSAVDLVKRLIDTFPEDFTQHSE
jgi:hypothetical protein